MGEAAESRMDELVPFDTRALVAEQFTLDEIDRIVSEVRETVADFEPDLATAKGRAEIASRAHRVSRFKVRLDTFGKDLVAEEKEKIGRIDAARKRARDQLDALRDEVRAPLTEWEQAEARRVAEEERRQAEDLDRRLAALAAVHGSLPVAAVKAMTGEEFGAILADATAKHEAEQARLAEEARLEAERQEAERKAREEEAARLAKIREEQERVARELAEREAALRAEQERMEAERRAAEEARRREQEAAERAARAEQERREAAERAAREERERIEQEARERAEAEERARAEAARQEALRPDREKLRAYSAALIAVPAPVMATEEGRAVLAGVQKKLMGLAATITREAAVL